MKEAKTAGFRVLPSYYQAIREQTDRNRLRLYDAIFDFGFGNAPEPLPPVPAAIFTLIKPSLANSVHFFERQAANGAKGGRKPKCKPDESDAKTQTEPKEKRDSDSESDSESECESESASASERVKKSAPPKAPRFTPPSVEEIAAYCRERGNAVDPNRFADYYAARGWRAGSGQMKDWRAAVRTWERRDETHGSDSGEHSRAFKRRPPLDFHIRYDNDPAVGGGGAGANP